MNFAKIFYDHFEEKDGERKKSDGVTFAPSYLNQCARQIFYKKTNHTQSNPIDLPSRFKMHFGTVQHEGLQKILIEKGLMIECEEHKQIDYAGVTFNYYLDGIVMDGDEKAILEIKTIYGRAFDFVKEAPKDDHMMQVLSYMAFEDIKKAYVVYIGRDNGLIRQHVIESNGDLLLNGKEINQWRGIWKDKVGRLAGLKKNIEAGEIPDRDFSVVMKKYGNEISYEFTKEKVKYKTDWQCSYCQWKDACWKSEIEQMNEKSFYINGEFE